MGGRLGNEGYWVGLMMDLPGGIMDLDSAKKRPVRLGLEFAWGTRGDFLTE
jgi:hypothetical protein